MKRVLVIIIIIVSVAGVAALAIGIHERSGEWQSSGQAALDHMSGTAAALDEAERLAEQRRQDSLAWVAVQATQTAVAYRVEQAQVAAARWQPVQSALPWLVLTGLLAVVGALVVAVWRWGAGVLHRERVQIVQMQYERDVQVERERKALPMHTLNLTKQEHYAPRTDYRNQLADNQSTTMPQDDLYTALRSAYNLLVIGSTGGGKTTLLQHLATIWKGEGEVWVVDPDAAAGDWQGCKLAGAADDWRDAESMLQAMLNEALRRRELRKDGHAIFRKLYCIVDEAASVKGECDSFTDMLQLARRSRKLGMVIVIGVQDKQVRTLGIEGQGDLRSNYTVAELRAEGARRIATVDGIEYAVPSITRNTGIPDTNAVLTLVPNPTEYQSGTSAGISNDDAIIAALVARGVSSNKIFEVVGGKRADVLARIKQARDEVGVTR